VQYFEKAELPKAIKPKKDFWRENDENFYK